MSNVEDPTSNKYLQYKMLKDELVQIGTKGRDDGDKMHLLLSWEYFYKIMRSPRVNQKVGDIQHSVSLEAEFELQRLLTMISDSNGLK